MTRPVEYELPDEYIEFYYQLRGITKTLKELKEQDEAIRTRLKVLAEGADFITVGGERVLQLRRSHPYRFDAKAFQADHPRLHEAYLRQADEAVVALHWIGERP